MDAMTLPQLYTLIESWNSTNITLALTLAKGNAHWRQALKTRYLPLLQAVGRKTLRSLPSLPQLLLRPKHYQESFAWAETQQEVLATLPVTDLSWVGQHYRQVGEWVTGLASIKTLYVQGTNLRALPETLGRFQRLEHLVLHHNRLRALPDTLGELQQLRHLSIIQHRLPHLPNHWGALPALERLMLVQLGRYSVTHEGLAQCLALRDLTLVASDQKALPASLYRLPLLERLECRASGLVTIDDAVKHCHSLRELNLSHNPIQYLSPHLAQLPNLERLNLTGTPYFVGEESGELVGYAAIQDFFKKNFGK